MNNQDSQNSIAPEDLSRRAVSLARYIQRLQDGEYVLVFSKKSARWHLGVFTETEQSTIEFQR